MIPSVEGDHNEGLRLSVEHLARLGRRRIAHINAPLLYNYGQDRQAAFRRYVAAAGLSLGDQIELEGDLSERGGYELAKALLDRPDPPDAVIAINDAMAIGVIHALVQRGLRPGADISLIGCDDIPVSALLNPPLTTLRLPYHDMGVRVAEHLLQRLGGNAGPLSYIPKPELVIRST
jgi:LacI family transcriptional regulator